MATQQLLNSTSDAVAEMIEGLVMMRPSLKRLDGYKVVVKAAIDKSKVRQQRLANGQTGASATAHRPRPSPPHRQVAVISGGGAGHEPSHAGWVGDGMLSAAVSGSVFASPSTAEVLAAILHVTGAAGCLVVVKNYTGDRLNFGLACEHAKASGLRVEMVVVGDDCALPHRGLGTLPSYFVSAHAPVASGRVDTRGMKTTLPHGGTFLGVAPRHHCPASYCGRRAQRLKTDPFIKGRTRTTDAGSRGRALYTAA